MAGNGLYALYHVKADANSIFQCTNHGITLNAQSRRLTPLGVLDPTAVVSFGSRPSIRFSTTQLKKVLEAIGLGGLDVSSSFDAGFIERSSGGGFETTGLTFSATKCLIVPDTIQATQDDLAEVSYVAMPYSSNGTTVPLALSTTLVAGTPEATQHYTLGSVTIGGAALGKAMDWSLQFGISADVIKDSGTRQPRTSVIRAPRMPGAVLTVADLGEVNADRIAGVAVADVVFNLKKMSNTGAGFEGSDDCTITMKAAHLKAQEVTGQHPSDAALQLMFEAYKSGANDILSIAFA
jgi:hypothetical protein